MFVMFVLADANIYDGVNSLMLHVTRFEHLDVTLLCTTYHIYIISI